MRTIGDDWLGKDLIPPAEELCEAVHGTAFQKGGVTRNIKNLILMELFDIPIKLAMDGQRHGF